MSRYKPELKTYAWHQPANWWARNPFLFRYMIREWSSLLIVLYALVLLWGLYDLNQGETSWNAWLAAMASPPFVLFHLVTVVVVLYHSYTWFRVMPKTIPPLPLQPRVVTLGGWAAVAGISVLVLILTYGLVR
jgi:fumarate reductase subunit C